MDNFNWNFPTEMVYGVNRIEEVGVKWRRPVCCNMPLCG